MSRQIHKGGGVLRAMCAEKQGFVDMLGYKRVAMKSDQEQAMRALQQRVQGRELRDGADEFQTLRLHVQWQGGKGHPGGRGACQDFQTPHQGAHRNDDPPPNHPIIHWMAEHAAETINRLKIVNKK